MQQAAIIEMNIEEIWEFIKRLDTKINLLLRIGESLAYKLEEIEGILKEEYTLH